MDKTRAVAAFVFGAAWNVGAVLGWLWYNLPLWAAVLLFIFGALMMFPKRTAAAYAIVKDKIPGFGSAAVLLLGAGTAAAQEPVRVVTPSGDTVSIAGAVLLEPAQPIDTAYVSAVEPDSVEITVTFTEEISGSMIGFRAREGDPDVVRPNRPVCEPIPAGVGPPVLHRCARLSQDRVVWVGMVDPFRQIGAVLIQAKTVGPPALVVDALQQPETAVTRVAPRLVLAAGRVWAHDAVWLSGSQDPTYCVYDTFRRSSAGPAGVPAIELVCGFSIGSNQ